MLSPYISLFSLALAAGGALAQGLYLSPELSFGQTGRISPNGRGVPNYNLLGDPIPEILSNKIVLTPVSPGGRRGALWAEKPLQNYEWTADVQFRASGPERGGGNLQIWIAKDGQQIIGTSSIYTASKFEGLGIILDPYAGTAGTVRAFLNDGSVQYNNHHSVDSLAFGHCAYAYRNLGRPSQIQIRQSRSTFTVDIDGHQCFESTKIQLPIDYYIGVTAASADNPDSFEIFKVVVTTDNHNPDLDYHDMSPPPAADPKTEQARDNTASDNTAKSLEDVNDPPVVPAEAVKQDKQFADLHNRLQALMKHVSIIQRDISHWQDDSRHFYDDVKNTRRFPFDQMNTMDRRIEVMERNVVNMERSIKKLQETLDHGSSVPAARASSKFEGQDYKLLQQALQQALRESHSSLLEGVTGSVDHVITRSLPRWELWLIAILGFQGLLAAAYVFYKRRRSTAPKKYV